MNDSRTLWPTACSFSANCLIGLSLMTRIGRASCSRSGRAAPARRSSPRCRRGGTSRDRRASERRDRRRCRGSGRAAPRAPGAGSRRALRVGRRAADHLDLALAQVVDCLGLRRVEVAGRDDCAPPRARTRSSATVFGSRWIPVPIENRRTGGCDRTRRRSRPAAGSSKMTQSIRDIPRTIGLPTGVVRGAKYTRTSARAPRRIRRP